MIRLALLGALLLAPGAAAVSALEDAPRLGPTEARIVVRAEGELRIVADQPVRVELLTGPWHGLDDVTEIVLRRDANEPRTVEMTDASGVGLTMEWPVMATSVPAFPPWAAIWALAALGRRSNDR